MKNLSLFITLGLVTILGTFAPVNAQMDTGITKDKDTQNDGIIELHDESSIKDRYTTDADANRVIQDDTIEVRDDQGNIIDKDEVDGVVEITTDEESAEFTEPVEEPTPVK